MNEGEALNSVLHHSLPDPITSDLYYIVPSVLISKLPENPLSKMTSKWHWLTVSQLSQLRNWEPGQEMERQSLWDSINKNREGNGCHIVTVLQTIQKH